jgi:PAS domain S-box-containing protein
MGIVLPSLYILFGICLHAGISHLLLAARRRTAVHLLFGLLCFLAAVYGLASATLYSATTVDGYVSAVRLQLVMRDLWILVFVWFVAYYSTYRPVRFLLAHNAVVGLALVLNLCLPLTLFFSEIRNLEPHALPWGGLVQHVQADASWLAILEYLPILIAFAFSYECCRRQFIRGMRSSALFLAAATSLQMVGLLNSALIDFAELEFVYIGEFTFISFILVMNLRLTDEFEVADAMLQQREERLQSILSTAADSIITIDRRGFIANANLATEKMFGYSWEELIGKHFSVLLPSQSHTALQHNDRNRKSEEDPLTRLPREVTGRRKDDTYFPVELAVSEIENLGLLTAIIHDISESKALQRHVLKVAADEQRRIGQELHDGTVQELTGLTFFAGALLDGLRDARRERADGNSTWVLKEEQYRRLQRAATRLADGLTKANQHVHELSHGIMPVQIDAEGLCSALNSLAREAEVQESMSCTFDCPDHVRIPDNTTATHLYRIAQEALNNAMRHSRADRLQISLSLDDDATTLLVHDNGSGFDRGAHRTMGPASAGMGLRTMRYRAAMIGGELNVEKNESGGTSIRCSLRRTGTLCDG